MAISPREYLFGRINYERRTPRSRSEEAFDLGTMRRLAEGLGHPELTYPIVHVAGTKGKGSTAAMIAAILNATGLRTGLYTSPHLERLEERFQIAGSIIPADQLDQLINQIRPFADELDREADLPPLSKPTFFEITTALAFQYFRQESVDVAVVEVGLGGRLDSTNICRPVVSVITNIGMDHMHLLGDTLALIAEEKAGIIKSSIPTVSGEVVAEAAEVIARIAADRGSPLALRDRDYGISNDGDSWDCWTQISSETRRVYEQLEVGMLGNHQRINAATAIATCEVLRSRDWSISNDAIRQGLAKSRVAGRIEIPSYPPRTVLDIAHNVPSLQALIETLNQQFPNGQRTLVASFSREKDLSGMLACLPEHFDRVVLTRFLNNPRAAEPDKLAELLRGILQQSPSKRLLSDSVIVTDSPTAALEYADQRQSDEWLIVAGSAFLVAECRALLNQASADPRSLVESRKASPL